MGQADLPEERQGRLVDGVGVAQVAVQELVEGQPRGLRRVRQLGLHLRGLRYDGAADGELGLLHALVHVGHSQPPVPCGPGLRRVVEPADQVADVREALVRQMEMHVRRGFVWGGAGVLDVDGLNAAFGGAPGSRARAAGPHFGGCDVG